MGRKHSEAFVERQIARVDEMYERNMQNIKTTPSCLMPELQYSAYGSPRLAERERELIKEYYKQFQELSYVRGFWMGWSLCEGVPNQTPNSVSLQSTWMPFEKFDFKKVGKYLLRYKHETYKNCIRIIDIGEQTKEHGWFFLDGQSTNVKNLKLDAFEYAGPMTLN